MDKKGYLYFSQKILKTQLEQIRQKYFMSPQAWEKYYQKNKNNLCKEADSLLIAEMSLLGKKLPPHFSSILDLGCGFGANSLFLAEQGWQVTAIDISKTAIERLQEQAKQNNLLLTAQQADAVCFSSKEKFEYSKRINHLPSRNSYSMNCSSTFKKKSYSLFLLYNIVDLSFLAKKLFRKILHNSP